MNHLKGYFEYIKALPPMFWMLWAATMLGLSLWINWLIPTAPTMGGFISRLISMMMGGATGIYLLYILEKKLKK